jgi:glucan biosynthesis protein C
LGAAAGAKKVFEILVCYETLRINPPFTTLPSHATKLTQFTHVSVPSVKTPRLHALDALRAIMMLLGLVIHTALTYNVTKHGNSWGVSQTVDTSVVTDFLVLLIHTFRMPTFFMIAGFFGALLFYERGVASMVRNRVSRILWPFIVFLLLLMPIKVFCFRFTEAVYAGNESPWSFALTYFNQPAAFLPDSTSHLWFLYYLMMFTLAGVVLALLFAKVPKLTELLNGALRAAFSHPALRILFFSGLAYVLLMLLDTSMVNAAGSLTPELPTFLWFGFFYAVGWVLYFSRDLLMALKRFDWLFTVLGVLLVAVQGVIILASDGALSPSAPTPMMLGFASLTVWVFTFGITGLFLRYASAYSPVMRYVSDASYWVYLIHLPLTALLPGFIAGWQLPALVKFLLVLLFTTIICFVTYHYFVRNTFIGQFLNGRKYEPGLPKNQPVSRYSVNSEDLENAL